MSEAISGNRLAIITRMSRGCSKLWQTFNPWRPLPASPTNCNGRSSAGGVILIVQVHPVAHVAAHLLVPALRREVEVVVGTNQRIAAPGAHLKRAEYVADLVPVEHAHAREVARPAGHRFEIVDSPACCDLPVRK